jgi:dTDP-4-dehydrorhamnose 3,5-epimerase
VIFTPGKVQGSYVVDIEKRSDERGYFARWWCAREFEEHGLSAAIAQVNLGFSPSAGTLRGLHFQDQPHDEVKVAGCLRGAVYDVIVDLRPQSSTYGRWMGVELHEGSGRLLYAPAGCAHGYLTLLPDSELFYMTSKPYAPAAARGVRYDDPAFKIAWPRPIEFISDADRGWPDWSALQ